MASSAEVMANRLSRRRARTANEPSLPAMSATAASIAASGSLATRTARQTRAMPMTSRARSAILSAVSAGAASLSGATRMTITPSRCHSRTCPLASAIARRMLACSIRSN